MQRKLVQSFVPEARVRSFDSASRPGEQIKGSSLLLCLRLTTFEPKKYLLDNNLLSSPVSVAFIIGPGNPIAFSLKRPAPFPPELNRYPDEPRS